MARFCSALVPLCLLLWAAGAGSAAAAADAPTLPIGYIDLKQDIRYDDWGIHPVDIRSATEIKDRRGFAGAQLGLADIKRMERLAKVRFALERAQVDGAEAVVPAIERLHGKGGVDLFLIDLPDAVVADIARKTRDLGVLLFNVSATGDALRNDDCQPHLIHTAPSRAMLTDAMAQFLVAKKWRKVLVLQGPQAQDAETVAAFRRSAELFGLDIVDVREFVLGIDPRARDKNDLAFLTGRVDYEVVFVADVDGEFALGVPYRIQRPAPVVGAAGLVARAWHWSHMRHGAPQVHGRFERMHNRRMGDADWGAWIAMKLIAEAVVRTKSAATADIDRYLKSDKLRVDGSKGKSLNLRPWSNQLRQPILLATSDWVTAIAPIAGFRHRTNDLDTLGYGERETTCRLR